MFERTFKSKVGVGRVPSPQSNSVAHYSAQSPQEKPKTASRSGQLKPLQSYVTVISKAEHSLSLNFRVQLVCLYVPRFRIRICTGDLNNGGSEDRDNEG